MENDILQQSGGLLLDWNFDTGLYRVSSNDYLYGFTEDYDSALKLYNSMEVRKLLEIFGGSQIKMAQSLGVTQPRISEYINGKKNITVKRLKEWCNILNIDIKQLF